MQCPSRDQSQELIFFPAVHAAPSMGLGTEQALVSMSIDWIPFFLIISMYTHLSVPIATSTYSVCHSVVSDIFATSWTVAHQAPLSMGFPKQEYWSGLPFPFPGDCPDGGMEAVSPLFAGRFFTI